jgi:hypothetical protein
MTETSLKARALARIDAEAAEWSAIVAAANRTGTAPPPMSSRKPKKPVAGSVFLSNRCPMTSWPTLPVSHRSKADLWASRLRRASSLAIYTTSTKPTSGAGSRPVICIILNRQTT